jgi:hypothetical protein
MGNYFRTEEKTGDQHAADLDKILESGGVSTTIRASILAATPSDKQLAEIEKNHESKGNINSRVGMGIGSCIMSDVKNIKRDIAELSKDRTKVITDSNSFINDVRKLEEDIKGNGKRGRMELISESSMESIEEKSIEEKSIEEIDETTTETITPSLSVSPGNHSPTENDSPVEKLTFQNSHEESTLTDGSGASVDE